jgi:hypothetical protein
VTLIMYVACVYGTHLNLLKQLVLGQLELACNVDSMALQQFHASGIYSVADQNISQRQGHSALFAYLFSSILRSARFSTQTRLSF